jgi:ribosomal protein S18 acetylase RimI-like enzyme
MTMRTLVRPDGRTCLYFRDCPDDAYGPLLDEALPALDGDVYTEVDADAHGALRALRARGFEVHRREHHYAVPIAGHANAPMPEGFAVRTATEVDVVRLAALDDALRQDVPGAAGWRNDPAEFARQTFDDPEFDPQTYLIAVGVEQAGSLDASRPRPAQLVEHAGSLDASRPRPAQLADGACAGLVRVWRRPQGLRLGLIGVLPPYRRRGLALALLTRVFAVLDADGEAQVTCEVDETNEASNALMRSLGARRTGGGLELKRAG